MDFLDDISGASGSDKKAKKYLNQMLDDWGNVKTPATSSVDLQGYDWLGDLAPEHVNAGADVNYNDITSNLSQFAEAGPTAMEGVRSDPRLQENQMASLAALEDIYKSGGLTAARTKPTSLRSKPKRKRPTEDVAGPSSKIWRPGAWGAQVWTFWPSFRAPRRPPTRWVSKVWT
jgi:hypothetical protein